MNYEKRWSKYWYYNILDVNNENVNFNTLSLNRNISLEVMLENIDKPWDFDVVNNFLNGIVNNSSNFDFQFVTDNPDKNWCYYTLSRIKNLTWDVVESTIDKDWDFDYLTSHPNISTKIILENINYSWDFEELSCNHEIPLEFIMLNQDKPWSKFEIGRKRELTMDFIRHFSDKINFGNYWGLSCNQKQTNLISVIKDFPDKNWHFGCISSNSVITWNDVIKNSDIPWNFEYLSMNPNITIDIVKSNLEKDWNYIYLSKYSKITINDIINNMDLDFNHSYLGFNKNINLDELISNDLFKIDYHILSESPNLTFDIVYKHKDKNWDFKSICSKFCGDDFNLEKYDDFPWDFDSIDISFDIIFKYPDKPWNYKDISTFKGNIPEKLIRKTIDKDWNFRVLSQFISLNVVYDFPDKDWSYECISRRKNLNIKFVKSQPSKSWCYSKILDSHLTFFSDFDPKKLFSKIEVNTSHNGNSSLSSFFLEFPVSKNPNITYDIVKANSDLYWDYSLLSSNSNFTINIIKNNTNDEWNHSEFSKNTSITWKDVNENPDIEWDYHNLCLNPMSKAKDEFIKECYLEDFRKNFMKEGGMHHELMTIFFDYDNISKAKELGLIEISDDWA